MNTAVITIKTNPIVKKKAQNVARELGLSLSTVINVYLKELIIKKRIVISSSEEPSDYMIKMLKQSKADIKAGRVSPSFTNAEDAIKWLDNPNRKYVSDIQQKIRQTKG